MNFLAPLFLAGAIAVALPVIFHLIRRTTRERKVFSSLMFLLPTPPRLTRRSRLEHLLLLALRCLALCLLAFAFARPFIQKPVNDETPAAEARRVVVLVDTSASMRRANLWADARDRVEATLNRAAPGDQIAIFTFDRDLRPLVTFEQWKSYAVGERAALAARRLAEVSPGWSATQLGNALIRAVEALADAEDKAVTGQRQIVVVSDVQEGSHPDPLQGYEWPKNIELSIESVRARNANNAGIQLLPEMDDTARAGGAVARVRVSNAADSKREQFKVGWARPNDQNFVGTAVDVYVPPGQSRIVPVPAPAGTALDHIILRGDDEDFDNTIYAIPPETARLSVMYFGNEPVDNPRQPLFFLTHAFQETRRQSVQVLARPGNALISAADVQATSLFVVTDSLSDESARVLHEQVAAGKTLLFVLRNPAAAPTLARLSEINSLAIEEGRPDNYAMLAEIDFRHPLFAPFADPRFSDFTKIHFWKYRRMDSRAIPSARVVAKFDSGDPAVLEVPVGKGRLVIFTSGWQPEDSQLALSTKFVPMMYSALDYSGASAPPPAQYAVGDVVPLGSLPGMEGPPSSIKAPDGSELKLASGETNFSRTTMPGVYALPTDQAQKRAGFVVNLDAAESRTAPLPTDELERLGAPVAQPVAAVAQAKPTIRLQNSELENRQKLWRWVLLTALAVLLFETWLAGRTARRVSVPIGETAAMQT